jgi:hypothetical protein
MTPTIGLIAFAAAFAVPFFGMLITSRSHGRRRAADSARNMEERMAANWRPASVTELSVSEPAVTEHKLAA